MEYKKLRNKVVTEIKNDEKEYNTKLMKGENKWKTAKKLMNINQPKAPIMLRNNNNEIINNPKEMSEDLNNFFIEKPKLLREKIGKSNICPLTNYRKFVNKIKPRPYCELHTINMNELKDIVDNMKPSKSLGNDMISMKTIKYVFKTIDSALLNIIK